MDKFANWLNNELNRRGWNYAELSRQSGMSRSMISRVISGYNRPGLEFCKSVADALDIPATIVLQLAGHLPSRNDDRNSRLQYRVDEIAAIWDRVDALDPDTADRLLAVVKAQGEMALLAIRASQRLDEGETDEAAERVRHTDA